MNPNAVLEAVNTRYSRDLLSISSTCAKFFEALDASLAKKRGAAEDPVDIADYVFRDGQRHYYRMRDMARYGADDLKDILKTELDMISGSLRADNNTEAKFLMHIFMMDVGRHVHSYPSRLSTLIDNLHLLVAFYYGIPIDGEYSIKAAVGRQLAEYNRDLKYHLTRQVVKKGLDRLRNTQVHGAPGFMEWMELLSEAESPALRFHFMDEEPSRTERAFDHLFPFYQKTLESAAKAVDLLLA